MMWSSQDILLGLSIAVAVMLIVALYHIIFIVVDVRKIARRIERLTQEAEDVLMKPLRMTDDLLNWLQSFLQERNTPNSSSSKKKR